MKLLALVLLLSFPAAAQYAHRSNPGATGVSVTTNVGTCAGTTGVCATLNVEGVNTVLVNVSGTWTGALSFQNSNNYFSTVKVANCFLITNGVVSMTGQTSTTANGDFECDGGGYRGFAVTATATMTGTAVITLDGDPADTLQTVAGVGANGAVPTQPVASSTAGTGIACNAGVSPCTVTSAALTILNANASRKACQLCAWDVVDLYCKRNTSGGSAASATSFDFALNAGSATKKIGGCWACDTAGTVWQGAVNCIASAASAVVDIAVSETN